MIPRREILGRLKPAFTYVGETKRTEMWRKRGDTLFINIPKRDAFEVDEARIILRQARLTEPEIEQFLSGCLKH